MARHPAGSKVASAAEPLDAQAPAPMDGPAPRRRVVLPPDWLPRVLVGGDALLSRAPVLIAYWYRRNLDFIDPAARDVLFTPYLAAVPVAMLIYGIALFFTRQYRSWRGQTLVDQLLSLYGGLGLATILVLATISLTQTGALYSRLTITYSVAICVVLMSAERFVLREYETRLRRRGIGVERV